MSDPSVRLRNAVISGNYFIVTRLLRRYPEFLDNIDPSNGWTNLHYAAFHDRYEVAEILLGLIASRDGGRERTDSVNSSSSPSSVNRITSNSSPREYTQITSEDEIKLDFEHNTVIHAACSGNASHTLSLLLEYFSVCIDQRGKNGFTSSHISTIKDNPNCLSILLENGAYPGIIDDAGNTPLHLALQYGHMKCAQLLVEHKADDTMVNIEGWSPLDLVFDDQIKKEYEEIKKNYEQKMLEQKTSRKYSLSSTVSSELDDSFDYDESLKVSQPTRMRGNSSLSSMEFTGLCTLRNKSVTSLRSGDDSPGSISRHSRLQRKVPPPPLESFANKSPSSVIGLSQTFAPNTNSSPSRRSTISSRNHHLLMRRRRPSATSTITGSSTSTQDKLQHRIIDANTSLVELNDATSKLNDFKSKNDDRLKLDMRLGNFILNNSQESLNSSAESDSGEKATTLGITSMKKSRLLSIPISSMRDRHNT